ncbi:hypothetical protein HELRODRAFT_192312 [Helobdella robusta]|uniref:glycerophosphodiester phosphodiesterase n=1 Tax=Helobdella robusta TaxID=6412 RepID=T1FTT6_HELRO|nr:hypothetical protein HELRODRAFT_192312 [Helobdella robusta]ESO01366.1 hypothetical protein HELRODRAFT_192312 [Helobdella robusta]
MFLRSLVSISVPSTSNAGVKWTYDHELDHVTTNKPLIIAHRGFSGAVPEHTVEAYEMAVEYGADVIECDAALTKDLVVVCLHECWMNESTDVASKFAPDRSSQYFIPGSNITIRDYFSIDFTLEELKTLGKVEKRTFRNQDYNGKFKISTLEEMIGVAKSSKRPIGLHVELKDATFFNTNVPMLEKAKKKFEDIVIEILHKEGYSSKRSPCFVQSFYEDSLMYVSSISPLPLVYLMDYPADTSQERLKSISKYAYGIGPDKRHFVQVDDANKTITGRSSDLIKRCRDSNLRIHTYTFRNEFMFLPWDYHQDPCNEMMDFFLLGIDGYFTDFPETAFNFFSLIYHSQKSAACSFDFNLVRLIILFSLIVFNYFF